MSYPILKEYVENFIGDEEKKKYEKQKRDRIKTPLTERQKYLGLLEKKPTPLMSRTTFQLDSEESWLLQICFFLVYNVVTYEYKEYGYWKKL